MRKTINEITRIVAENTTGSVAEFGSLIVKGHRNYKK